MKASSGGLVVIGPTPPPFHGVAVMTGQMISAIDGSGALVAKLDTADRRPLETIGRFDFENVRLGFRHAFELANLLRLHRGASVYFPISQSTWGFMRDALLVLVGIAFRRRVYAHFHGASFQRFYRESPAVMKPFIRFVLRSLTEVWVLTESLRGVFKGLVDSQRIRVVENVIDDPWPAGIDRSDRGDYRLRIVFLGNLLPDKGVDVLLDSLLLIADQASDWSIRIVGKPFSSGHAQLESRVKELVAMGVDVKLLGSLHGAEKDQQLEQADIFAYPTRDDGQPLVLLEAMAAGLAIVATRVGGIPDTLADGDCGLIIEPGGADQLAAALLELAADPKLRIKLGESARSRFEANYRPERLERDMAEFVG